MSLMYVFQLVLLTILVVISLIQIWVGRDHAMRTAGRRDRGLGMEILTRINDFLAVAFAVAIGVLATGIYVVWLQGMPPITESGMAIPYVLFLSCAGAFYLFQGMYRYGVHRQRQLLRNV